MIYAVVGTHVEERKKAFAEILHSRNPTFYIQKEMLFQVPALIDAQDLFGGEILVMLEQAAHDVSARDTLTTLLPGMQASKNTFIFDEPFIDTYFIKTLEKYCEKVFNAKEEKEKKGFPTAFLSAIERRDKKIAWVEWMKLRNEEAEILHGALWWKVKMIWQGVKEGRRAAFSEQELTRMSYTLVTANHKAHRGEADLKEEMEKIVLSL